MESEEPMGPKGNTWNSTEVFLLSWWSNTGAQQDTELSILEDIKSLTGHIPVQSCSCWPVLNRALKHKWSPENLSKHIYFVIHTTVISTLCWWGYCSPCPSCLVGRALWLSWLCSELQQWLLCWRMWHKQQDTQQSCRPGWAGRFSK